VLGGEIVTRRQAGRAIGLVMAPRLTSSDTMPTVWAAGARAVRARGCPSRVYALGVASFVPFGDRLTLP
jgi:hypothetical protein